MQRAGLAGVTGRPRWKGSRPELLSKDLVDRQFTRDGPNQLRVTDITEHHTREGQLYCAVLLGAYSRRVVGWSIDASLTTQPNPGQSAGPPASQPERWQARRWR